MLSGVRYTETHQLYSSLDSRLVKEGATIQQFYRLVRFGVFLLARPCCIHVCASSSCCALRFYDRPHHVTIVVLREIKYYFKSNFSVRYQPTRAKEKQCLGCPSCLSLGLVGHRRYGISETPYIQSTQERGDVLSFYTVVLYTTVYRGEGSSGGWCSSRNTYMRTHSCDAGHEEPNRSNEVDACYDGGIESFSRGTSLEEPHNPSEPTVEIMENHITYQVRCYRKTLCDANVNTGYVGSSPVEEYFLSSRGDS